MFPRRIILALLVIMVAVPCVSRAAARRGDRSRAEHPAWQVEIFRERMIHFTPGDSTRHDSEEAYALGSGRVAARTIALEHPAAPTRVTARVATRPIPKDDLHVHDPWDRAGNVRLRLPGQPDIEIVKFVTAYGGVTEHEVDVTHLAPLLTGPCTFLGFVDTWSCPGWRMDFSLSFEYGGANAAPDWARGILYEESVTAARLAAGELVVEVEVPAGLERVVLNYLVSGHCTAGRAADEFVSKDNVIRLGGEELLRLRPWRDDCRRFRAINPYCRRWSDGSWSCDYSRSGWCPGDVVAPLKVELGDRLGPGRQRLSFDIEDVRPEDENGHFGYWRVSAHLLGWED